MSSKLLISLTIAALLLGIGCLEMDKEVISAVDFNSEVRFVNLTELGTATVTLEDTIQKVSWSFGVLVSGEASSYKEINAGSRKLVANFSEGNSTADTTMSLVFATDKKSSVFILGDTSGTQFINAVERYIFDIPTTSDSATIRILNGLSEDYDISVSGLYSLIDTTVTYDTLSTDPLEIDTISVTEVVESASFDITDISFGDVSSRQIILPRNYEISVDTSDVFLFSGTLSFEGNKWYTIVVVDTLQEGLKKFIDD